MVIKGDTRSLDYSSYEGFQKLGVPFWGGPYDKDYSAFGSLYIQGNYHMELFSMTCT